MKNTKNLISAAALSAVVLMSAVVPGMAAEASSAAVESAVAESSYTVPIDRTQKRVDGRMTIVETYEVPAYVDPNTLVKDAFEQSGVLYNEHTIVKTVPEQPDPEEGEEEEGPTSLIYTVTYKGYDVPEGSHVESGRVIPNGYAINEDGQMVEVQSIDLSWIVGPAVFLTAALAMGIIWLTFGKRH